MSNIILTKTDTGYEIITGHHRYLALLNSGAKIIHAVDEHGNAVRIITEDHRSSGCGTEADDVPAGGVYSKLVDTR